MFKLLGSLRFDHRSLKPKPMIFVTFMFFWQWSFSEWFEKIMLCFFLRLSVWLRASRKPEGRGGLLAAPLFSKRFVFLFIFVFVFFGPLFSNQSGFLWKRRCVKINQPPFANSALHPNQQSKLFAARFARQTRQTRHIHTKHCLDMASNSNYESFVNNRTFCICRFEGAIAVKQCQRIFVGADITSVVNV